MSDEDKVKKEIKTNSDEIRLGVQRLLIKALKKTQQKDFDFDKHWPKAMSLADKSVKVLALDAKLDEQDYGSAWLGDDGDEDEDE